MTRRHDEPCFVYYVASHDDRYVKIGSAKDPIERFTYIQSSNAYRVRFVHIEPGNFDVEYARHEQFRHLRHHGEWFEVRDELEVFLRDQGADLDGLLDFEHWRSLIGNTMRMEDQIPALVEQLFRPPGA